MGTIGYAPIKSDGNTGIKIVPNVKIRIRDMHTGKDIQEKCKNGEILVKHPAVSLTYSMFRYT